MAKISTEIEVEAMLIGDAVIRSHAIADGVVNFSFVPSRDGDGFECFCKTGGVTHRVRSIGNDSFYVMKIVKLLLESIAAFEDGGSKRHGPILSTITDATDAK
jgi:hypothetical protein